MALVYEFSKIYKKRRDWLQYIYFKNLRKKTVMASVYEFSKSTKKDGKGFSM